MENAMPQRAQRRPNLFIIGAMKSGTTSLHHYLSAHPEVFMCEPKEPGFFAPEMTYYPREEEWYLSLFGEAGDARWVGESSTHYTKLPMYPGVAARVAAYAPDARLIYLMRDPVERAISHYWHNVRYRSEWRPMEEALAEEGEYHAFSDYARQLEPYLELFPRDRIRCYSFEEMVRDPTRVVREVLEWLELDPALAEPEFSKENARPERFRRVKMGTLHRFGASRVWDRLSPLVPRGVKELASRIAYDTAVPEEVSSEEVVRRIRPVMAKRARTLQSLLGREFPEWTTTFPPAS